MTETVHVHETIRGVGYVYSICCANGITLYHLHGLSSLSVLDHCNKFQTLSQQCDIFSVKGLIAIGEIIHVKQKHVNTLNTGNINAFENLSV